ncbi:nitroreductase family protein [Desulfobulbus sp. AH-315-M07]|nr:nitroreductase family protein [Desulfobulbus sp. AH-315-M07]
MSVKPPSERPTQPLDFTRIDEDGMRERAEAFLGRIRKRRSVRHFSDEEIPLDVVERCIEAAAQAPSGANKQPWTFVLVTDKNIKRQLREAAEIEERAFYAGRASQQWLADLAHLGTGPEKPFLEHCALIVVFAQRTGESEGERNYYVTESVGMAVGILLAALNDAGLATLVHTPSPMRFLREILDRPTNEQAYCIIPVGFPTKDCRVPDIERKKLSQVLIKR